MIERYRRALDINEKRFDFAEKEGFSNIIIDFTVFANKVLPHLKEVKGKLRIERETKAAAIGHYKQLFKLLEGYEEENLLCYQNGLTEELVMTEAKKRQSVIDTMDNIKDNLNNPFEWMYYWCKGEIYDLKALVEAVA